MNGNVGINQSNPIFTLDISGNTRITGNLFVNGVPITGGIVSQWTTAASGNIYFQGNVGIGRGDPQFALDVSGNVRFNNTVQVGPNIIINGGSAVPTPNFNLFIGTDNTKNTTGSQNNAGFGARALTNNTTGANNTAIGFAASASNTTGSSNTTLGYNAGTLITTGTNNTAIGTNAFSVATNLVQSTAIGYNAQPTTSNQIVLGTATESVTIPGTAVSGNNISGALQVAGGVGIGGNLNVGGNIYINGVSILGLGGQWSNGSTSGNIYYQGNVAIGKGDPQYTLDISGTTYISGTAYANYFITTSDYRIKNDPVPLDLSFNVDGLKPIHYTNTLSNKQDLGFIAHEVQEVFPYLVDGEKDGTKMQSLNYIGLIAVLVKEVQELKKTTEILKSENRSMQLQINRINEKM
jgi:hypothetical protein